MIRYSNIDRSSRARATLLSVTQFTLHFPQSKKAPDTLGLLNLTNKALGLNRYGLRAACGREVLVHDPRTGTIPLNTARQGRIRCHSDRLLVDGCVG